MPVSDISDRFSRPSVGLFVLKNFFLTGPSSRINNTLFKGVLKHKGVTYIYMYGF